MTSFGLRPIDPLGRGSWASLRQFRRSRGRKRQRNMGSRITIIGTLNYSSQTPTMRGVVRRTLFSCVCPILTVDSGHCGKLLREFEAYEPTKLLMLNAASERSISIYHHYGWKVRARSNSTPVQLNVPQTFAQHMLGVGKVAEDGTAAKGEKAKGVLLELMVKVRDAPQVYAPCVC